MNSILLFKNKSYPSSFALSVVALEELGKYLHLEDFVWHSRGDGRLKPKQEEEVIKLIFSHRHKQRKFSTHVDFPMFERKAIKNVFDGVTEKDKQNALYVGLPRDKGTIDLKGKISTPTKITRAKTEEQITIVNDFIVCLTAGVIKETLIVDIWELEDVLTPKLLNRLRKKWPKMSKSAKRKFINIIKVD